MVAKREIRSDVCGVWIDAQKVAETIGSTKAINMVILGAYLEAKNLIEWETITETIKKIFADKNEALIQLNLKALEEGRKLCKAS